MVTDLFTINSLWTSKSIDRYDVEHVLFLGRMCSQCVPGSFLPPPPREPYVVSVLKLTQNYKTSEDTKVHYRYIYQNKHRLALLLTTKLIEPALLLLHIFYPWKLDNIIDNSLTSGPKLTAFPYVIAWGCAVSSITLRYLPLSTLLATVTAAWLITDNEWGIMWTQRYFTVFGDLALEAMHKYCCSTLGGSSPVSFNWSYRKLIALVSCSMHLKEIRVYPKSFTFGLKKLTSKSHWLDLTCDELKLLETLRLIVMSPSCWQYTWNISMLSHPAGLKLNWNCCD